MVLPIYWWSQGEEKRKKIPVKDEKNGAMCIRIE